MDINDVNPWEALGLTEPETAAEPEAPAGEQEQEPAAPAGEGEQDQEPAAPDADDDMEDGQEGEPEEKPEKKPLTKEERAANARRRRQQEVDDAVAAARADEQKKFKDQLDAFFKAAKMKNAHNGNADILTLDDAMAWVQADRMAKANDRLRKGQMTAEDLQAMLEDSPAFKELRQKQEQQEQAVRTENQQKFQMDVQMELAEIQKLDPTVKSLADIIRMDTGKEFARLVQKGGLSYLEAFRLANMDRLMEQRANVAATAAKVASGGKDHLTRTRSVGNPVADVPQDVKDRYRIFNPQATDEEIERHYRKELKK